MLRSMLISPWILLFVAGAALAEPGVPADETLKVEMPTSDVVESARAAVAKLGTEVVAGRYGIALERMYPKWKERLAQSQGGMDKVNEGLAKAAVQMQQNGVTLLSSKPQGAVQAFEVSAGKKVENIGGKPVESLIYTKWLLLVPTVTQFKFIQQGKTFTVDKNGFQVAISDKGRNDWTFIDGSTVTVNDLRSLFPNFPADTKLPSLEAKTLDTDAKH